MRVHFRVHTGTGGDTRLADRVERLQYLRAREGDAALLKPLLMYTNVW